MASRASAKPGAGGLGANQPMSRQSSPGLSVEKSKSFLNPTGATGNAPPPREIGPCMEMIVFFSFVMIRAIHPVVIDASKTLDEETGKKGFAYQTSSVVVLSNVCIALIFIVVSFAAGGAKAVVKIFKGKAFLVFFGNGLVYALGDFMEMAAMGGLSGAAYQILLQSKIIITAVLMMFVKSVFQTRLQWILLVILMCAMSVYMTVQSSAGGGSESSGGVPIFGMILAFVKVVISCVGAVVSDKYMKVYADDPNYLHLARTFCGAGFGMTLLSFAGSTWQLGFFSGWDSVTPVVLTSFVVKSAASVYIVALLDSILKNIGESFSVLVIYTYDVLAPWVSKIFDTATFLAVLVVVAACAAYVDAKVPIEKAALYEKQMQVNAAMGK